MKPQTDWCVGCQVILQLKHDVTDQPDQCVGTGQYWVDASSDPIVSTSASPILEPVMCKLRGKA